MTIPAVPTATLDEGEIVPDVDDPWAPAILNTTVGVPAAGLALGAGMLTWWVSAGTGTIAPIMFGMFAAALVVLGFIDALTCRLPNAIVLPLYPALMTGVAAAAMLGEISWPEALVAAGCMTGSWVILFVFAVISGGLGYGDVKLGGLIGLVLGLHGVFAAALGSLLLPMIAGGVIGLALVASGWKKEGIAFGPYLAAGGLSVLLFPDIVVPFFAGSLL